MRVSYQVPSLNQFDLYFATDNEIKGGSVSDIRFYKPYHYNTGGSLFGLLSGVVRKAIPFLRGMIFPELPNFASNVMQDFNNNVPIKKNIKSNLIKSARNITNKIVRGGKRKNRKNIKRKNTKVKPTFREKKKKKCLNRHKKDIFDQAPFDL